MATRLIDANVVLRVLLRDDPERVVVAENFLLQGGTIRSYVLQEIIVNFLSYTKRAIVQRHAESADELQELYADPAKYAQEHQPKSDWKVKAFQSFGKQMARLLEKYPNVVLDNDGLYKSALNIARRLGHDWVDCLIRAEHNLFGYDVVSMDSHLKDIAVSQGEGGGDDVEASKVVPASGPLGKMKLE